MISEFWPKNIMISDFGLKKLPNSGIGCFNGLMEKKLFHVVL